jgi:hypothetical protein
MEVELLTILPIVFPSLLLVWLGIAYLRKRSVILSMGVLFGLIGVVYILMFATQVLDSYYTHLELVEDWGSGTPPTFNWFIFLIPILMMMPLFLFFGYFFRNGILIYNIKDEDLSKNLNDTLKELNWEYEKDFTYINVKEPKIKIKVGMIDPMRTCNIFFRGVKDQEVVKQFKEIIKRNIETNDVKPFFPAGLLFVFMGIFLPLFLIVSISSI